MAYIQRRTSPREQRLCSVCYQTCSYSYTFCDNCSTWVHNNCDAVDEQKLAEFERLPLDFPYICRKCRSDDERNFDFTKAMQRLHKAAVRGFKKLKACVKREVLFLDGPFVGFSSTGNLAVDSTAQILMQNYLSDDFGIPAVTSGMDHVLFRAASLAVCAKDSLACELRVRCCIEMVTYENFYRYQKNNEEIARFAPDYVDSCLDCALMNEGSSAWTMSALASVIRRPIMSVFPFVNGLSDPVAHTLNTTFKPREGEISCQLVRILWSSENVEIEPGKWKPNHFVPIFDQQRPKNERKRPASDFDSSQDMEDFSDVIEEDDTSQSDPLMREHVEMDKIELGKAEGGYPVESNKFMDIFEAFEKITTATEVHSDIPRGVKENVWFLIDNSHNVRHPERRNTFFDDCGVWDSKLGSVAKNYLLLDDCGNVMCTLKIHEGRYQKLIKSNNQQKWVVLDPQPDPDKVVVCHRYYAFLKRDNSYKRRVVWFNTPRGYDKGSEVALVEYMGTFPGFSRQIHGNSKRGRGSKSNYRRTDPKLLEQIANQIKSGNSMKPMKMYKEIQKKLGADCTLRDPRQIRNLKYSVMKRLRKEQGLEGEKMGEGLTVAPTETPEIRIVDESGVSMVAEPSTEESPGPIKVIFQHDSSDVSTAVESLEGLTQGSYVELEDAQQVISLLNSDGSIAGNSQTIIVLKSTAALPDGSEVVVSQPEVVVTQPEIVVSHPEQAEVVVTHPL